MKHKMALIAAHLNAGHSGGDSVAIGIYSPSSPTSIPPSSHCSPSLVNLMVSVDVKHHVYLLMLLCHHIQSPGKIRGREVIWTKIKSREVELGLRAGLLLL